MDFFFLEPPWIYVVIVFTLVVGTLIYWKRKSIWKYLRQWKLSEISIGPIKFTPKSDPAKIKIRKDNSREFAQNHTKCAPKTSLPRKLFGNFIGRDDEINLILAELRKPLGKPIVGLYGMGGIGKSALAREVADRLIAEKTFNAAWWTTAKLQSLDLFDEISADVVVSYRIIIDRLASWLGIASELRGINEFEHKERRIQQELQDLHLLLVLDNLETSRNQNEIAAKMAQLINGTSSRVIITSREETQISPKLIEAFHVAGLVEIDSIRFLRETSREQRQNSVRLQQATDNQLGKIAKSVGGMPLAMKLAVGLLENFSINEFIDSLKDVDNQKINELYDYLFISNWRNLTQDQKELLVSLSQFDEEEGASAHQLLTANNQLDENVKEIIEHLVRVSLIEVSGDLEDTRYQLHPLTHHFIRKQCIA